MSPSFLWKCLNQKCEVTPQWEDESMYALESLSAVVESVKVTSYTSAVRYFIRSYRSYRGHGCTIGMHPANPFAFFMQVSKRYGKCCRSCNVFWLRCRARGCFESCCVTVLTSRLPIHFYYYVVMFRVTSRPGLLLSRSSFSRFLRI